MKDEIKNEIISRAENIINNETFTDSSYDGGYWVRQFEEDLQKYIGRPTLTVNSGTSALVTALHLAGVGYGDEVIVPALTFKATWNAVMSVGATPVPIDIKLTDFTMDTLTIRKAITKHTKAIIPVHLYGNVCDMEKIKKIVADIEIDEGRKIFIIEDACQAFGSNDGRNRCGNIGDFGCFSFYPSKIINTMEGGAVSCNEEYVSHVRKFRNHGDVNWGLNLRMNEMSAMMGSVQMGHIDEIIRRRKEKEMELYNQFKDEPETECNKPRFNTNGQLFTLRASNRDEFLQKHPTGRVYYDYSLGNLNNATIASMQVVSFATNI